MSLSLPSAASSERATPATGVLSGEQTKHSARKQSTEKQGAEKQGAEKHSTEKHGTEKHSTEKQSATKRCCLTRNELPRTKMVRFVASPEGVLVPDLAERLPRRGAWVAATSLASVESSALVSALKRALKVETLHPEVCGKTLIQNTQVALTARILSELGLARRSGLVVSGEQQVRAIVQERGEQVRILLQATDGAEDGVNKIVRLMHHRAQDCLCLQVFSAEEQGHALGRNSVVHIVVLSAPANRKYNPSSRGEDGLTSRLKTDLTKLQLINRGQKHV